MFDTCGTLEALNRERQSLMQSGRPPLEVNNAYNKAKKRLLEETPAYRKIPTYECKQAEGVVYLPFPILKGSGRPNEIILTPEGVLL